MRWILLIALCAGCKPAMQDYAVVPLESIGPNAAKNVADISLIHGEFRHPVSLFWPVALAGIDRADATFEVDHVLRGRPPRTIHLENYRLPSMSERARLDPLTKIGFHAHNELRIAFDQQWGNHLTNLRIAHVRYEPEFEKKLLELRARQKAVTTSP